MTSRSFRKMLPVSVLLSAFALGALADEERDPGEASGNSGGDVRVVPQLRNGDWNADGRRNITDLIGMMHWLFIPGSPPAATVSCVPEPSLVEDEGDPPVPSGDFDDSAPTHANGDVNLSGRINISDVVWMARWLFVGGDEPREIPCHPKFAPIGN